jgi:hypothetical protein
VGAAVGELDERRDSGVNFLVAVAAVSANDIWAVGHQLLGPFTERWDGTSWKIVPTLSRVASLIGMTALSDGTIVTVGRGRAGASKHSQKVTIVLLLRAIC